MYTKTIHSLPQSALYPNILSFLVRSSLQVKLWVLSLYIKLADISVVQIYNITFPFILCIIKHESSCSRTEREREGGNRQRVKVIKWSQGTDREREREKVVGLQKHCGGQEKRLRERDGWVKRRREWLPGSLSYGMSSSAAVAINYRQLGVIVTRPAGGMSETLGIWWHPRHGDLWVGHIDGEPKWHIILALSHMPTHSDSNIQTLRTNYTVLWNATFHK